MARSLPDLVTAPDQMAPSPGAGPAPAGATAAPAPAMPPPEPSLPAGLAHQLAANISHRAGHAVEITLNPEELGKLTMSIASRDGTLTLALTAERGATLDLLRQHIDQLAQDFRDLGFDRLQFSFGRGHEGQQRGDPGPAPESGPDPAPAGPVPAAPPAPSPRPAGRDMLDIRL
ncbi:MAG: flagellar hook-length control protein FliK [Proteobacteria bacterium]|nr:flagellar hook-length control protein FliK [Pseudomonadota bacterium]MBS0572881.1 flagellar hook-length control protein FliK [Pseudomonadota bacterium]